MTTSANDLVVRWCDSEAECLVIAPGSGNRGRRFGLAELQRLAAKGDAGSAVFARLASDFEALIETKRAEQHARYLASRGAL